MNEPVDHRPEAEPGNAPPGTPGDFVIRTLAVIVTRRRFLTGFAALGTILAIVLALILPKWYKASASVFPAENIEIPTGVEGLGLLSRGFSAARALTSFSGSPELDRYSAILKSKNLLDEVIREFDLVQVYDITKYPVENTRKELLANLEITVEPEGNITVAVYDKDPQRAADMANFFIDDLNRVNSGLLVQNARANREFIEKRYHKNLDDLAVAEDSLKSFQKRYGILALPQQAEASIKAVAELMGTIASKEIENRILERTVSPDHPSLVESRIELQELNRKVEEYRTGSGQKPGEMNVFVPFAKYPDLGAEYIHRFRDVEIQYKILQFVTPLYEQAKLDERRQTPSVLVLDRASPPERKAKPRISVFGAIGLVLSSLIGLFAVFLREAFEKLRTKYPEHFQSFGSAFRRDREKLRAIVGRRRRV